MSYHFEMQGNITVPEMLVEDIEYYLDHEFDITPEVTPVASGRDEGQQKMCVISFDASYDWRFPDDVAQTLNQLTTTFGCYGEIKVESDDLDKRFFSIVAKNPGDKWEEKIGQVIYGDITENLTKKQMYEIHRKIQMEFDRQDAESMVETVSHEYELNKWGCEFELPYALFKEKDFKEISKRYGDAWDFSVSGYDLLRSCVEEYLTDPEVAKETFKDTKELRFRLIGHNKDANGDYEAVITVNHPENYIDVVEKFKNEIESLAYVAITSKTGRWETLKLESVEFVPERELTLDEKLSQKAEMVNGDSGRETKNRLKEER